MEAEIGFLEAALRRHDDAVAEKDIADLDRRGEQSAGIAAKVEHEPLQRRLVFLLQALDAPVQLHAGVGLELAEAHVRIAWLEQTTAHAGDADDLALQRNVDRIELSFVHDAQRDFRADLAAQTPDRTVEIVRLHGLAVDAHDRVAGLDAGALGGRIVDRRDDAQRAFDLHDFDAEAVVAAGRVFGEIVDLLAIEVFAVRIEAGEQAADRRLHQLMVVDVLDIGLLDQAVDRSERADVLQIDAVLRRGWLLHGGLGRVGAGHGVRWGRRQLWRVGQRLCGEHDQKQRKQARKHRSHLERICDGVYGLRHERRVRPVTLRSTRSTSRRSSSADRASPQAPSSAGRCERAGLYERARNHARGSTAWPLVRSSK